MVDQDFMQMRRTGDFVLVLITLRRDSLFRYVVPAHFLIKVGSETKAR